MCCGGHTEFKNTYFVDKCDYEGVWCLKKLLKLKKSGDNCCERPNFLYELWVTATAAATADDQTLTHSLLDVKHCLQPPKPKPLITPGLSSPQLQRKGKC